MKVMIVGYSKTPFKNDSVGGGAQQVEKNQIRLLQSLGHDVVYVNGYDSDHPGDVDGRTMFVALTVPAKNDKWYTKISSPKQRIKEILSLTALHNPDLIITNDETNQALLRKLTNLSIPSIVFIHSSIHVSGGPGMPAYLQTLHDFAAQGHTVCCVSEISKNEWSAQIGKSAKYCDFTLSGDEIFTEFWHPAVMWELPDLKPAEHGFVTVGRLDKFKNYHVGFEVTKDLVLFAPSPRNEKEHELSESLREDSGAKIHYDRLHPRIMDYISKSQALFVLGPESFGLTAFEANAHGVPVVLITNRDKHPVEEVCRLDIAVQKMTKKEAVHRLAETVWQPYSDQERLEIQTATWEYYNPSSAGFRLHSMFAVAITKFKANVKKTGLEAFV